MRKLPLIFAALLAGALTAQADTLVTTRPAGTDSVDWSQLGGSGTGISNPFSFTTTDGVTGTGSYAGSGGGVVYQQGNGWFGNFANGDFVNYTGDNGAITLNFSQGYTQIGAQIQENYYGPFTAQICDASTCFTENGTSNGNGDGSAIYIGISSATPIDSVTFSLTYGGKGSADDFAINQVTLNGGLAPTPEPSSLLLLGTGLAGFAGALRRKFARN